MSSIPLDRTVQKFVTTNVTINVFGPWKEMFNSLPVASNLLRINLHQARGDNNNPDVVSYNIGVGPLSPPTIKIEELILNHEQVGSFSGDGAWGDFVIPVNFPAGSRVWAQVKGIQNGGAFDFRLQIVFMTQQ